MEPRSSASEKETAEVMSIARRCSAAMASMQSGQPQLGAGHGALARARVLLMSASFPSLKWLT